jgi:transcriptional regulator with XRE-family HTH domain
MTGDEQLRRFGDRLREMRILVGANQQEFAGLGGVKKNSQVAYETGKTAPTVEYLYRLAGHGVDIGYILTGRREDGSQGDEERRLVDMFTNRGGISKAKATDQLSTSTGRDGWVISNKGRRCWLIPDRYFFAGCYVGNRPRIFDALSAPCAIAGCYRITATEQPAISQRNTHRR